MTWLDDRIDRWHNEPGDKELHEFLGMSQELYSWWVSNPPAFMLGLDEVGYGAWAGPLVTGAVLAPCDWTHPSLCDSKAVSEKRRASILSELSTSSVRYFIHRTSSEEVDQFGLFEARLRSWRALVGVFVEDLKNTLIVIDGNVRLSDVEHVVLPKADSFVPHVMAASLIAKVYRDTEMMHVAQKYPQYGFEHNKGYGGGEDSFHAQALEKFGPCPIHRRSFKPVSRKLSSSV